MLHLLTPTVRRDGFQAQPDRCTDAALRRKGALFAAAAAAENLVRAMTYGTDAEIKVAAKIAELANRRLMTAI